MTKRNYTCPQCKEVFCDYASNHRKFCSVKCHYVSKKGKKLVCDGWNKGLKGHTNNGSFRQGHPNGHPRWTSPKWNKSRKIERTCLACSKEFTTKLSQVERGGGKFCSHRCYSIWRSDNIREDKCYQWKGGVSKFNTHGSAKYIKWRKAVYKKDNYTCQICGTKERKIWADHIKPFSLILKENNLTAVDTEGIKKCEELWDIKNGRAVCVRCAVCLETHGGRVFKFLTGEK